LNFFLLEMAGDRKDAERIEDAQGLYYAPSFPNSVQWADDGTLAVAAYNSVSLLHPGNLSGPRSFVGFDSKPDSAALTAAGRPHGAEDDAVHELNALRIFSYDSGHSSVQAIPMARSVSWSPSGCSDVGTCLLAAVVSDHRVRRLRIFRCTLATCLGRLLPRSPPIDLIPLL
jgi:hypothetical protein